MPSFLTDRWRNRINRLLRRYNLRIEDTGPFRPRKDRSLRLLRKAGLRPSTVFDVGVYIGGTPSLYQAFPAAKHVLIEPVPYFREDITRLSEELADAECIWAAASNYEGTAKIDVKPDLKHAHLVDGTSDSDIDVDVVRLDRLTDRKGYTPPYLIKVDVDGREIDVLEGASDMLDQTDCVILEATTEQILPRLGFMRQKGFRLWDIVDLCYAGDPLWQVDLVLLSERCSHAPPPDLEQYGQL